MFLYIGTYTFERSENTTYSHVGVGDDHWYFDFEWHHPGRGWYCHRDHRSWGSLPNAAMQRKTDQSFADEIRDSVRDWLHCSFRSRPVDDILG